MKKILTIFVLGAILSFLSIESKAQIVKGEAFMGLNLSQVDGDQAYGYRRLGFHGGLGAIVPIYKKNNFNFDIALEVVFDQKGSHQRAQYVDNNNNTYFTTGLGYDGYFVSDEKDPVTGAYDLYMNYLEVPLIFYFSDKQLASIGIGFSYGRLIGLKEYEHGKLTNVNLSYTGEDKYNLNDFCFLGDLKIRIYDRLKLGVRFQYSMAKIRTRDFYLVNGEYDCTRDQYNNTVTARLIYVFNEDRSEYIRDEYVFRGDNPKIHQKSIDKKLKKLRKQEERALRKAERSLE